MLNCFEHPWLLIIVSFVLLIVIYIVRTSSPEKSRLWHLLIPIAAIAAAFALDHFVMTDNEKISNVFTSAINAVEAQNPNALEPLFAQDYTDRLHKSKAALMQSCRRHLTIRKYQKITKTHSIINIENEKATAELLMRVHFSQSTNTESMNPEFIYARVWLTLKKQPNKTWQITSTDKVEINNNPVSWN